MQSDRAWSGSSAWLDQIAKLIAWLLVVRALSNLEHHAIRAMRCRLGAPSAIIGQSTRFQAPLRVIIGGRLRQRFFHGSIGERVHWLYRVLADMDGFATQLAARMRDGFTRIFPIVGAPSCSPAGFVQAHIVQFGLCESELARDTS